MLPHEKPIVKDFVEKGFIKQEKEFTGGKEEVNFYGVIFLNDND